MLLFRRYWGTLSAGFKVDLAELRNTRKITPIRPAYLTIKIGGGEIAFNQWSIRRQQTVLPSGWLQVSYLIPILLYPLTWGRLWCKVNFEYTSPNRISCIYLLNTANIRFIELSLLPGDTVFCIYCPWDMVQMRKRKIVWDSIYTNKQENNVPFLPHCFWLTSERNKIRRCR